MDDKRYISIEEHNKKMEEQRSFWINYSKSIVDEAHDQKDAYSDFQPIIDVIVILFAFMLGMTFGNAAIHFL